MDNEYKKVPSVKIDVPEAVTGRYFVKSILENVTKF